MIEGHALPSVTVATLSTFLAKLTALAGEGVAVTATEVPSASPWRFNRVPEKYTKSPEASVAPLAKVATTVLPEALTEALAPETVGAATTGAVKLKVNTVLPGIVWELPV